MKFLLLLSLIGHTVMARQVPPAAVAPVNDGEVSHYVYQGVTIWYAHSYLSGRYFYDQQVGSVVTVVEGGELHRYKVVEIVHVPETQWGWHDFDPYVSGSDMLLFTCWDGGLSRGYGQAIGRMIIRLVEVPDAYETQRTHNSGTYSPR